MLWLDNTELNFFFFSSQKVDKQELCYGYEKITKPRPDEYLKMHHGFSLTADTDSAEIQPKVRFLHSVSNCGALGSEHFYNGL